MLIYKLKHSHSFVNRFNNRSVRLAKTKNSALVWNDAKILCKEKRTAQRKWKETRFIGQVENTIVDRDSRKF